MFTHSTLRKNYCPFGFALLLLPIAGSKLFEYRREITLGYTLVVVAFYQPMAS